MNEPDIPHNGGPCPVRPKTRVKVKFRDGQSDHLGNPAWIFMKVGPNNHDLWRWQGDPDDNIIAYCIHQPAKVTS